MTGIEAPLSAKGDQSLPSEWLSQPIKVKKPSGDSRGPVAARSGSRVCRPRWTSPFWQQIERLREHWECWQLEMWEQQGQQATASLHPGTDVMAMIQKCHSHLDCEALWATTPCRPHCIRVCVRKQTLNLQEAKLNEFDVVTVLCHDLVMVHEAKQKPDLTSPSALTTLLMIVPPMRWCTGTLPNPWWRPFPGQ